MNNSFYRRRLPHAHPHAGIFMITWRLHGSLPQEVAQRLEFKKRAFVEQLPQDAPDIKKLKYMAYREQLLEFETYLDNTTQGPFWLKRADVAQIVIDALRKYDGEYYRLEAYTIMANHVHVLLDFGPQSKEVLQISEVDDFARVSKAIQLIKGSSARYANLLLNRTGHFWDREYYDRYVRNEQHFDAAVAYILQNPVKAKICEVWREHPFTWRREG